MCLLLCIRWNRKRGVFNWIKHIVVLHTGTRGTFAYNYHYYHSIRNIFRIWWRWWLSHHSSPVFVLVQMSYSRINYHYKFTDLLSPTIFHEDDDDDVDAAAAIKWRRIVSNLIMNTMKIIAHFISLCTCKLLLFIKKWSGSSGMKVKQFNGNTISGNKTEDGPNNYVHKSKTDECYSEIFHLPLFRYNFSILLFCAIPNLYLWMFKFA